MTNPTPQDREMAEKLADKICGCANREQHRRDVADLLAYAEAARLQGRREGLEEAAKVVKQRGRELQARAIDVDRTCLAIRTLYGAEPDKDGEG